VTVPCGYVHTRTSVWVSGELCLCVLGLCFCRDLLDACVYVGALFVCLWILLYVLVCLCVFAGICIFVHLCVCTHVCVPSVWHVCSECLCRPEVTGSLTSSAPSLLCQSQ
jgi:hypothetical protein